jgi:hypothetical protein
MRNVGDDVLLYVNPGGGEIRARSRRPRSRCCRKSIRKSWAPPEPSVQDHAGRSAFSRTSGSSCGQRRVALRRRVGCSRTSSARSQGVAPGAFARCLEWPGLMGRKIALVGHRVGPLVTGAAGREASGPDPPRPPTSSRLPRRGIDEYGRDDLPPRLSRPALTADRRAFSLAATTCRRVRPGRAVADGESTLGVSLLPFAASARARRTADVGGRPSGSRSRLKSRAATASRLAAWKLSCSSPARNELRRLDGAWKLLERAGSPFPDRVVVSRIRRRTSRRSTGSWVSARAFMGIAFTPVSSRNLAGVPCLNDRVSPEVRRAWPAPPWACRARRLLPAEPRSRTLSAVGAPRGARCPATQTKYPPRGPRRTSPTGRGPPLHFSFCFGSSGSGGPTRGESL